MKLNSLKDDAKNRKLKKCKKRKRNSLTLKILFQFIGSIIIMICLVFVMAIFVDAIFYDVDSIYWFIIISLMAAGFLIVTYKFISKPLGYLDEVMDVVGKLVNPTPELIELSDDLASVQEELNHVREKSLFNQLAAKEAEQRKNDLIVYLAHDLKTPLTSVIGYLTLLNDEPEISAELRAKYTSISLNKAERLEDLINEFFDITRFNLTHLTLENESINLSRMLQQITYEFGPTMADKGLWWNLEIEDNVSLNCDPDKLQRVFDNLIRNAINYSYPNTPIKLSMNRYVEFIVVVIENKGKTIHPEKLERLFEQFFRLDSSRGTSTGGAGLGLAIAKEIVELHGGRIHAQSQNESIRFTLELPIIHNDHF